MFDTAPSLFAGIGAAVDRLLGVTAGLDPNTFTGASPAELVTGLEQLQQLANLTAAAEQQLLAHIVDTDAVAEFGASNLPDLLIDRLHLRRSEAHARVRRAKRAGPRTTLTGEPLPPELECLAQAQATGAVSADHVDVVTWFLTKLEPHTTLAEHRHLEQVLVNLASKDTPEAVAVAGRDALNRWDPNGPEPRDLDRHRSLSARQADDGAGKLTGTLTPEVLAKLQTLLSPLAAPQPEDGSGEKDRRTVGQRQHDAFGLRRPPPQLHPVGLGRPPRRRSRLVDPSRHRRPRPKTAPQRRP